MADGPLNRGCSLQAIHGCCEMRLPHWLCPTLPRAVGGRIELLPPARRPAWMFFTTLLETFGIIWRSAFFRFRLFLTALFSLPFLSSAPQRTPSPPLFYCYWDSFILTCCSTVAVKAPGYIWQLLKSQRLLDLGISSLDLPVFTCALSLSALRWSSSLNSCK